MAIAVSWIQGVLRIGTGSSSSPRIQTREDAAYSREDFPAALAQGLVQAGVRPDEVFFGTDSPLIIPLMEEIPPATPAIAAKLIQRRAEKAKVFNEPVETGRTLEVGTVPGGPQRFLVHVAPAEWIQKIDRELDARGYHLAESFRRPWPWRPCWKKFRETRTRWCCWRRTRRVACFRCWAGATGRFFFIVLWQERRGGLRRTWSGSSGGWHFLPSNGVA